MISMQQYLLSCVWSVNDEYFDCLLVLVILLLGFVVEDCENGSAFSVPDLMRDVKAFVRAHEVRPLLLGLVPAQASFHLELKITNLKNTLKTSVARKMEMILRLKQSHLII